MDPVLLWFTKARSYLCCFRDLPVGNIPVGQVPRHRPFSFRWLRARTSAFSADSFADWRHRSCYLLFQKSGMAEEEKIGGQSDTIQTSPPKDSASAQKGRAKTCKVHVYIGPVETPRARGGDCGQSLVGRHPRTVLDNCPPNPRAIAGRTPFVPSDRRRGFSFVHIRASCVGIRNSKSLALRGIFLS